MLVKKTLAVVKYCVGNPVRDLMLVENECSPTPALPQREGAGRAVRLALRSAQGYAMLVENGGIMSLYLRQMTF